MKGKLFAAVALAAVLATASWTVDAQSRGDHWVGTWATAVVARPQAVPGGPPAPPQLPLSASGQPNACQPAAFGPPPGGARGGGQPPPR